ncbi:MAG: GNAT family N-acetyltransferase [Myxococcales bacterium]|nr:MAG: GNAT family N-acetyltransferase [Myxococcales bacterium]
MNRESAIRVLGNVDVDEALDLVRRDPVVNLNLDHRIRQTQLEPRWLGGRVWGRYQDGELTSLLHAASNVIPVGADDEACAEYSELLLREGVSFATIVGPRRQVTSLWQGLEDAMPRPRDLRWDQPHLEIDGTPLVAPDPGVTVTRKSDVDTLYPACVAMYTEEVGVSPEADASRSVYQLRVRQLVSRGWSFSRIEDDQVVFKAEVAASSPFAAQIQGVWVAPERRGEGLAAAGMAAVVEHVRRDIAPTVSLYVNAHNTAARRTYERVGFRQTETFSTLMF